MKQVTNDAISAYLEAAKRQINDSKIDAVLNLPKNFRWYAAKKLLTNTENEVAKITGIRKNTPDSYISLFAEIGNDVCINKAYSSTNFGKYQSTHNGTNVIPDRVGIRFEIGERYSKKYQSNDLYADYFFSVNDSNPFEFLVKLSKNDKLHKESFFEIAKPTFRNGTSFNFVYNHPLFKRCGFTFDRNNISICFGGYEYHLEKYQVYQEKQKNEILLKKIIGSFQNRKRIDKKNEAFNALKLNEIIVTVEDSRKAGNCEIGTREFANKYFKNELQNNIPITAEMILQKQNNDYTKRAIIQAAKI